MAIKKKIIFWASDIQRIPTKVTFKTKEGEKISFEATKVVRVPKKVVFYSKKRK